MGGGSAAAMCKQLGHRRSGERERERERERDRSIHIHNLIFDGDVWAIKNKV
jgi:hypothetical protein